MGACSYLSAEIVGDSLILTKAPFQTVDINLRLATVYKVGDSFFVRSFLSKSDCIPLDNDLLGGSPLTYEDVLNAISEASVFLGGDGVVGFELFFDIFEDPFLNEPAEFNPLFTIDEVEA